MHIPDYHQFWLQRHMLNDESRNEAFREALRKIVRPGQVVLDMGAGTGLLSIFAVQAGARRVYAVEATSMAEFARELVKENACDDRIEVIRSRAEEVELPEKVDVIVSEWLGSYAVDENLLFPLVQVRNRWLKPGGKMIPERVSIWMTPVWDQESHHHLTRWSEKRHGVDFSALRDRMVHEPQWNAQHIIPKNLLADPQKLWEIDIESVSAETARGSLESSSSFVIRDAGRLNALALWFHSDMGGGVELSNAPDAPWTHWGRLVLPLNGTQHVEPDETVSVRFISEPAGRGCTRQRWSVRINQQEWEHHDSARSEL